MKLSSPYLEDTWTLASDSQLAAKVALQKAGIAPAPVRMIIKHDLNHP